MLGYPSYLHSKRMPVQLALGLCLRPWHCTLKEFAKGKVGVQTNDASVSHRIFGPLDLSPLCRPRYTRLKAIQAWR